MVRFPVNINISMVVGTLNGQKIYIICIWLESTLTIEYFTLGKCCITKLYQPVYEAKKIWKDISA